MVLAVLIDTDVSTTWDRCITSNRWLNLRVIPFRCRRPKVLGRDLLLLVNRPASSKAAGIFCVCGEYLAVEILTVGYCKIHLCCGYLQKEAAVIPIILPFFYYGFNHFTVRHSVIWKSREFLKCIFKRSFD